MAFDLSTPHGRMMATVLAGIAEFERELTQERVRSGIAAAKARGQRLGRQPGQRPKSDRLAPKVLALVAQGRSYRLIGRELGLSKNTVADIVKRSRTSPSHHLVARVDGVDALSPTRVPGHAMRTYSGRPRSSMRFSTPAAMATSVC